MIRKAVLADAIAINTISKELGYTTQSNDLTKNRIKIILESTVDELFVFEDEQIKGWIHFFIANRVASSAFLEIGGLCVSSEFRREGVGRELINHALKWANSRELKTRVRCNSKRMIAHEFYLAAGFTKLKEQYIFEKE